jgi:AcrR family transcriptional regulator
MADAPPVTKPSPEARRQQILDAASGCVRQAGFHGASMADIAKAAGLSVGQIYRYFDNKEAIIAAIVAQDLAEMREKFAELERQQGSLIDAVIEHMPEAVDKVRAEAARNPKVAKIVRAADAEERALARTMIERARKPEWSQGEFEARAEVLATLFDGMVMRAVNNPVPDREALIAVLRSTMRHLLS